MTKARKTAASVTDEVRERLHVEGLPAALSALIAVCKDPNAPANAKATAGSSLLRAGGLFNSKVSLLQEKDLHEMNGKELREHLARLQRDADAALRNEELPDDDEGEANAFD